MRKRQVSLLKLNTTARRKLEGLAKRHKLTVPITLGRTIGWLAKQPELIQAAVLGEFKGPIDEELAKLVIRAITKI